MKWNNYPETVPAHHGIVVLKLYSKGYNSSFFGSKPDEYIYCFGTYGSPFESDGIIKITDTEIVHKRWKGFLSVEKDRLDNVVSWCELPLPEEE